MVNLRSIRRGLALDADDDPTKWYRTSLPDRLLCCKAILEKKKTGVYWLVAQRLPYSAHVSEV